MSKRRRVLLALSRYLTEIHRGVGRYAREHQWVLAADTAFDSQLPRQWDGDGVITLLGVESKEVRLVRSVRCPVVDVSVSRPDVPVPRVSVDDRIVAEMVAEHFLERGFTHFACCGRYELGSGSLRSRSFQRDLSARGHACEIVIWSRERGRRKDSRENRLAWLAKRIAALPKPLAVLALRDEDGTELIDACLEANIHVPEEVAIVGVGNNALLCDFLAVPLSSIDVGWQRIGYEAAQLLDGLMKGMPLPEGPILLPPGELVIRQSSDILAVADLDVARALRFVWESFQDSQLSVPRVAAAVGISRARLDKIFRRHLNRSLGEEILRIRLARVKELLLQTDKALADVAHQCGFRTLPHFYRTFKTSEHMTPRQYRFRHTNPKD